MDLKDIEEHYQKMPNSELVRIATTDANGLRPEVLTFIENEIKKRNLNPDILIGAIAQNKEYTVEELNEYAELLRNLPCPVCGNYDEKLNGTISYTVKSFIIITNSKKTPIIACPSCLDKKNNDAMLSTALLGLWGFPWGLVKTPVYIYRNYKVKQDNKMDTANNTLLSITLSKIGEIVTFKNNKEKLREIIRF